MTLRELKAKDAAAGFKRHHAISLVSLKNKARFRPKSYIPDMVHAAIAWTADKKKLVFTDEVYKELVGKYKDTTADVIAPATGIAPFWASYYVGNRDLVDVQSDIDNIFSEDPPRTPEIEEARVYHENLIEEAGGVDCPDCQKNTIANKAVLRYVERLNSIEEASPEKVSCRCEKCQEYFRLNPLPSTVSLLDK